MRIESPKQLAELRDTLSKKENAIKKKVMVCCGPGCLANGAAKIVDELKNQLKKKNIKDFDI